MSFFKQAGSFVGSSAASVYHGAGIARTEFAEGVREGYASRAAELAAKRKQLGLAPAKPVVQRKVSTKRVAA